MNTKKLLVIALVLVGIYFLLFHTPPFPFSHQAIGLPPYHMVHAAFGIILLLLAGYLWKKK